MAIHIQNGKNKILCNTVESRVQSVPFKILADCDAKVSHYFQSGVKVESDNTLKASYRGHPLKGTKLQLPQGYRGIVLHESIIPICDRVERKFHVVNCFNSIVYWNWDKAPSKNDKMVQAFDWIDIAEVLHSPIVEE